MSDLNFLDTSGNKQTITVPATNSMAFNTANIERLRITSNGNLLIGSSNESNNIRLGNDIGIVGTTAYTGMSITNYPGTNASHAGLFDFNRSRGTSDQSMTAVVAGDKLGEIIFRGSNGSAFADAATLRAYADSVSGSDVNGKFEISTGLAGSMDVRLRISQAGFVTKPNHPCFRATREGTEVTHTAQAIQQWNTVNGTNRSFDRYTSDGYGFNTSTHKYKVPVTGVWYFHAAVYTNSGNSCMFDIRTSSQILQRAEDNSGGNMPNNNIVHASCVVTCSKDDEVYVNQSGGQGKLIAGTGYISFDGHLIG